jgi:hypothetical protein
MCTEVTHQNQYFVSSFIHTCTVIYYYFSSFLAEIKPNSVYVIITSMVVRSHIFRIALRRPSFQGVVCMFILNCLDFKGYYNYVGKLQ